MNNNTNTTTKLISLDTSTVATGWAYYENGILVNSGVLKSDRMSDMENRITEMERLIIGLLNYYQPHIIIVEMVSVSRNIYIFRILSELVGAIRGYCVEYNIFFLRLSPGQWRSLVKREDDKIGGQKRDFLKKWSKQLVLEKYGKSVTDDEADAILIGQAYINLIAKNCSF